MRTVIDHLAVTAPDLATGVDYVQRLLGVELAPGGEHVRMGTHNRLLKLGDGCYLEVITINPAAPAPGRPRWFELDRLPADAAPRLATWVARSDDIAATCAAATEPVGTATPMSRGGFEWLITIPDDGSLVLGGVGPTLIQWQTGGHPAARLPEAGCRLRSLELACAEPERLVALLKALNFSGPVRVLKGAEAPALAAEIETPQGVRWLGAPTGLPAVDVFGRLER